MIDDMDIKYIEFKQSISDDFEEYCKFDAADVVSVISDLFKNFQDQKIRISIKCRKMPRFDRVETKKFSDKIHTIIGRIDDKKWICHVKQSDIADEQDITDLCSVKTKNNNAKIVRKIFISLKGIERNAFLLAKEQNVWVWDIAQLNSILRLFSKYELVI